MLRRLLYVAGQDACVPRYGGAAARRLDFQGIIETGTRRQSGMNAILAMVAMGLAGQVHTPVEYPFKQIEAGGFSRIRTATAVVIRSAKDYDHYCRTSGRHEPAPRIDWTQSQMIAVHIGSAPTTGYGVVVKRLIKSGPHTVVILVAETTPPLHHMQAMHVTYPFAIITIRGSPTM